MQPLTSLRTAAAAASVALVGILAAAPQANAATDPAALTSPQVQDGGRSLVVPLDVTGDRLAGTTAARELANSLAGTWLGDLIDYAARNSTPSSATCRAAVTATDSNGATGSAVEVIRSGAASVPLTIPDQAPGTRWGAGDIDHFTTKLTCTDDRTASKLSEITVDQDAIAA
jgi:hypothetical protein